MRPVLSDIIRILERMAPPALAEAWDNVGLQIGDPGREVGSVWVALDPSPEVVAAACQAQIDLLVTHHPLFFRAVKRIDVDTPVGAVVVAAVRHHLAVYAMHTNLDAVSAGLNDLLAQRIGLRRVRPLLNTGAQAQGARQGLGRIGALPLALSAVDLAREIKRSLAVGTVRMAGDAARRVKRVAIATGSGGSLLPRFLLSDAEAFISGDLRYHDAREIEAAHRVAIDVGHFHSESMMAAAVARYLRRALHRNHPAVRVEPCPLERDPFVYL